MGGRSYPPLFLGGICAVALILAWGTCVSSFPDSTTVLMSLPPSAVIDRQNPVSCTDCWRDIPVHAGVANITANPSWCADESTVDTYLLISALGPPTDQMTVTLSSVIDRTESHAHEIWHSGISPKRKPTGEPAGSYPTRDIRPAGSQISRDLTTASRDVSPAEGERWVEWTPSRRNALSGSGFGAEVVHCEVVWSDAACRVWRVSDEPYDASLQSWCEDVGHLLSNGVRPRVKDLWGPWPDVDGDGIVNLLVTNRVANYGRDLRAFVKQPDFHGNTDNTWSSPWDVVYVRPGQDLAELEVVLQHELTHVAQFSWCQALYQHEPWGIPDWITEGMAHATELALAGGKSTSNLDFRLRAYATSPAHTPLAVANAASNNLWRDPAQRGASAAFCYWWLSQTDLFDWPRIITSFQANHHDPWEQLADCSFVDLYREWTLAALAQGIPTEVAGQSQPLMVDEWSMESQLVRKVTGTATLFVKLKPSSTMPISRRIQVVREGNAPVQVTVARIAR